MRVKTGVCRPVDDLGRIVLPVELRRTLLINIGDPLRVEYDTTERVIVLAPHQPGCVFCGEAGEGQLVEVRGRKVCKTCAREAQNLGESCS